MNTFALRFVRLPIVALVGAIVFSYILFYTSTANAAALLSPERTEITVAPGETVTKSIALENELDQDVTYSLSVQHLSYGEDGAPVLTDTFAPTQLAAWLTLSTAAIEVKATETGSVDVTATVPESTPAGTYQAAVVITDTRAPERENLTDSFEYQSVATIIFNVTDAAGAEAQPESVVQEWRVPPSTQAGEAVPFTLSVKNTGAVYVRPEGKIEVYQDDKKIDQFTMNPDGVTILPGQTHTFTTRWTGAGDFGRYTVRFVPATEELAFASADLSFWVINWHTLFIVVGVFAAVIVLIFVFSRPAQLSDSPHQHSSF